MDKINIVSSQAVLEMSSFSTDTCSMSSLSLVNSLVKNRLFKTAPDIDDMPFQFIYTMDLSVVDIMLHDSPDLVIHRTEIWAVWGYKLGARKFGVSWSSSSTVARARCGVLVQCPAGIQSHYQTLCISPAAVWRHHDVVKQRRRSKRYHQNSRLCNNNEITTCIADLFNSFCEEVYAVAFFKVVQQQTIGWEIQLRVCGQIISVCNRERIIEIGLYLRKLCSHENGSSFFWLLSGLTLWWL